MDEDLISKKELLERYGISYGALYRWKRMGLIPESWFLRRSTPSGQETYFHTRQICPRVEQILQRGESSLEELAEKLGLPKETFTATVERYNDLAAKGEDEDFGKESYRLSTLSEAPFYGVRQAGGYLICTMDGIQIDDNMHAINHDFKAIPGLYVIGDMSGNYFSGSYPCLMAGVAMGRTLTFAMKAVKQMAGLENA